MSSMEKVYEFKRIGMNDIEAIKELFISVFTVEPWNDDWSNQEQLHLYLSDLIGQRNSLTYGLFENEKMIDQVYGHIMQDKKATFTDLLANHLNNLL